MLFNHDSLTVKEGKPGFDFLGFHIRQYPVGKTKSGKDCRGRLQGFKTLIRASKTAIQAQVGKLRTIINGHKHGDQQVLINKLNPVIRGWSQYYAPGANARVFQRLDHLVYGMLWRWAVYRHPNKNKHWIASKYWRIDDGKGWIFQPPEGGKPVRRHSQTHIQRHVQVQGSRSPFDGDWLYWGKRMGRHPEVAPRVTKLLKKQQGKCPACGLYFTDGEKIEVDHITPKRQGGSDATYNLQLLHRHCHDKKTAGETG